ncbi:MAG: hypothetical protein SFX18_12455 [Pirellulales bacterium]|nr:hypothetical protein [Pirellulales bacterium]
MREFRIFQFFGTKSLTGLRGMHLMGIALNGIIAVLNSGTRLRGNILVYWSKNMPAGVFQMAGMPYLDGCPQRGSVSRPIHQYVMFCLALLACFTANTPAQAVEARLLYKLTAPDGQPSEGFGSLLTIIDGDLLVTAPAVTEHLPSVDVQNFANGKAYLFDGATGAYKFALSNPEPMNLDRFAEAATGGDGQVFLSAIGLQERVYAFSAVTGNYLGKIQNPEPVSAKFGGSIAYGSGSLLVAAPSYSDPANDYQNDRLYIGQVYLYNANTRELELTIPNPEPSWGDLFGYSGMVVNRDSILISCVADGPLNEPSNFAGRVWELDRQSGQVLGTLENPNHTMEFLEWDWFGYNVAANEQLIVVSADEEDTNGIYGSGMVYIFDALSGNLLHALHSPFPRENAEFGQTLAINAAGQVLIGESNYLQNGLSGTSQVYLYDGHSGQLLATIINPDSSISYTGSVTTFENRIYISALGTGASDLPYTSSVYVYEIIPEPSFWMLAVLAISYFGIRHILWNGPKRLSTCAPRIALTSQT